MRGQYNSKRSDILGRRTPDVPTLKPHRHCHDKGLFTVFAAHVASLERYLLSRKPDLRGHGSCTSPTGRRHRFMTRSDTL